MTNEIQEYLDTVYAVKHLAPQKEKLYKNNYMRFITQEYVLLDDELWVHPDTIKAYKENTRNPKYIFFFKEKYLNAWSSTQTMRRYSKLTKWQIKYLQSVEVL